ncbi:MAG: SdrD B-like domain-containing protein, partial [Telluria sp.]
EAGVANATVTLIGGGADGLISTAADNTSVTTTTDANGNYKFTGLTPGVEYQVQFSAPAGSVFTAQDKGSDASDSDASTTGLSQIVKLGSGENNTSIDAGVYTPASLGDRVWFDANANGQQDSGEAGVAGATVTLTSGGADGLVSTAADNTTVTTTTDASGNYKFTGLTPGVEYQVQVTAPSGSVFTTQDKGLDTSDSDVDASTGKSQIVKLAAGENNLTIDAGVYTPASIGDRFWTDANGNGQQDAGETGVAGATVTLIGGGADGLISTTADNTSVTTTTDANGAYLFANLKPGTEYQVQFAAPAGMVFTKRDTGSDASDSDADTTTGKTQIVTLASGEKNLTLDAGVYKPASIGDRVWNDANNNGVQDAGEVGMAGVSVTLLGGGADGKLSTTGDNTSVTTTTDANGYYQFTNLNPGSEYQVQYIKPTGYVSSGSSSGGGANTSTGQTGVAVLQSGEDNKSFDIGLTKPAGDLSITKTDGVTSVLPGQAVTYTIVAKNTGTATATNAVVTDTLPSYLTNVSWTSSASSGASGNQASGTGSINSTLTLAGGASVTYTVKATVGSLASLEKVADFGSMTNNTNLGQNTTINGVHVDAAYITSTGQIGNAVLWARNSGTDKGLGVWSTNEASPSTTGSTTGELSNQTNSEVIRLTLADGQQWSSLWVSSLDKNSAGGAEMGTLYWSDSATPDLSTLTTKFVFKNGDFGVGAEEGDLLTLRPSGFDAEAKYLFFVAGGNGSTAKNDYLVWKAGTLPTQVANTASIAAPSGFTDTNSTNNSATDTDKLAVPTPAAIVRGSIGDLVWEDLNFNGVRDSGEAGIANVTVRLLDNSNNVLATTTTNSSGNYLFSNLNAGSYKVEVVKPTDYYVTKANIGSNNAIDSDIDVSTARSGTITLTQGQNDLTWDAGLYRKASIGDKVWRDSDHDDIQDAGEEGIPGVKVMLYSGSGTLLGTTTTNSTGNYKFANLDPGSYYLVFDKTNVMFQGTNMNAAINMNTWKWASKDIGTNDAIDSDVVGDGVATTNVTRTDVTTLKSGENDMTWDAAITPIAIDLNGDGVHTVARSVSVASGAAFDLLGNGTAIHSGWLSSSDGFLAVDLNGNGKIDGIGELFGGSSKGAGFAKLASYDSNGDGVVDLHDTAFAELRIWRDANGNHITDSGELMTLAEAGVSSLQVAHVDVPFVDAQGNLHLERSSVTLANGKVADMTDVYFNVDAKDAPNAATLADLVSGSAPVVHVQVEVVGQAPLPVI